MPLPDIRTRKHPLSISELTRDGDNALTIDLDPPCQRGHVWGRDRQVALIRSVLMGLPIGAIVINWRGDQRRCIDGKQRLQTLIDFTRGQVAVPADWFAEEDVQTRRSDGTVTFDDLTTAAQRDFRYQSVAVVETEVPLELEQTIFDLINGAGIAQGDGPDPDTPQR